MLWREPYTSYGGGESGPTGAEVAAAAMGPAVAAVGVVR